MTSAWFCPSCQKYHAPHVETCPGHPDPWGLRYYPHFTPTHLQPSPQCAGCKGVCGNAACPLLPRITSAASVLGVSPSISVTGTACQ